MIETNSTFSSYLELLNEKHSEGAESIRNLTINCLEKDYMVSSVHLFRLEMKRQCVRIYKIIQQILAKQHCTNAVWL